MKESNEASPNRILAISAHPDDIEFTSGGSLARWINEGWAVSLVVCTDGGKGSQDPTVEPAELVDIRRVEQQAAAEALGITKLFFLGYPDGELSGAPSLMEKLALHIRFLRPDRLVCWDPWKPYQLHPDHRAAGLAALDAVLAAGNPHCFPYQLSNGLLPHQVPEVYLYGAAQPDTWVDITATFSSKMDDKSTQTPTMTDEPVSLFDDLAAEYDSWYQTPLGTLAYTLEQEAVFSLAGEVSGRTTLDASCGTGHYALAMARRGARVMAADASAPMLALARTKAQREGLPLVLVRASLEHLPFRADSFELVTCILVLEFVDDPGASVVELARIQTPGGRLVLGALGRFSFWALWRRLKGLFRRSLWRSARFFSRTELNKLMHAAGYGALSERQAIYFPPVNSARLLPVLRRMERLGHRWAPGTAAFLAVAGDQDGDIKPRVEQSQTEVDAR